MSSPSDWSRLKGWGRSLGALVRTFPGSFDVVVVTLDHKSRVREEIGWARGRTVDIAFARAMDEAEIWLETRAARERAEDR